MKNAIRNVTKSIMKILKFYLLSCVWCALYTFVSFYIADKNANEGEYDYFSALTAYPIALITICGIYCPIWTVLAVLYQKLKINEKVIEYPLIVSIAPFVICELVEMLYGQHEFKYLVESIVIAENIIIVVWSLLLKKRNKR